MSGIKLYPNETVTWNLQGILPRNRQVEISCLSIQRWLDYIYERKHTDRKNLTFHSKNGRRGNEVSTGLKIDKESAIESHFVVSASKDNNEPAWKMNMPCLQYHLITSSWDMLLMKSFIIYKGINHHWSIFLNTFILSFLQPIKMQISLLVYHFVLYYTPEVTWKHTKSY